MTSAKCNKNYFNQFNFKDKKILYDLHMPTRAIQIL